MDRNYLLKNDLIIRVYTVGFDPKGESILLTICDGELILFSGLIDCFITDNDYLIKLLDKLNIKKINYLCITHPDADHCIGIQNIVDRIDKNTKVAIPSRIFDFMDQYDQDVKESLSYLYDLFGLNSNNRRKPIFNTVSNNSDVIDNWTFTDSTGKPNELKIATITPTANIIERYAYRQLKGAITVEHNDFSIINLIKIGDVKILLTGDAMNDGIKEAFNNLTKFGYDFFNSKIDFVKIPHHTSIGSNLLLDIIKKQEERIGVSTTTVFRSSDLPNYSLFSDYNAFSEYSYCTCPQKTRTIKNGIVLYEADLTNSEKRVLLVDTAVKFENYNNV